MLMMSDLLGFPLVGFDDEKKKEEDRKKERKKARKKVRKKEKEGQPR